MDPVSGGHEFNKVTDWRSSVLRSRLEIECAVETIGRLGLRLHPDRAKNWDSLKTLNFIRRFTNPSAAVVDLGCANYGRILFWLKRFHYRDLHGCDRIFLRSFIRSGIRFTPQNIEFTKFPDSKFDVASCLSVIEHGVNLEPFLDECRRIIRPNGYLVLSTDYWEDPLKYVVHFDDYYNCPIRVFNKPEIEGLIGLATERGFKFVGDTDLSCSEKTIYWSRSRLQYTFVFLTFRRCA